ncbi:hypothetical protein B0H14DRAFT_2575949 [Mycena olivaceomarginata]|nr:hypothetical protein B0H14DRAFT_2575949 [Mycena olivaceomarginata]
MFSMFPLGGEGQVFLDASTTGQGDVKPTTIVNRANLAPESDSEIEGSEQDGDGSDGRTPDVLQTRRSFGLREAKAVAVVSDDEEVPFRSLTLLSLLVLIPVALKNAAANKAKKGQLSDEDMLGDEDLKMHEATAEALTTVPRSRRSSTASWSSGQDINVPVTDLEDLESAHESENQDEPVAKAKVRKVSEARQKKADLERFRSVEFQSLPCQPTAIIQAPSNPSNLILPFSAAPPLIQNLGNF